MIFAKNEGELYNSPSTQAIYHYVFNLDTLYAGLVQVTELIVIGTIRGQ